MSRAKHLESPPSPRTAYLSSREVWLGLAMLFVAGMILHDAEGHTPGEVLLSAASHNIVYIIAYAALFLRLSRVGTGQIADGRVLTIAGGTALACLAAGAFDVRPLHGVPAMILGIALVWRAGEDRNMRAAGIVFLALAAHLFWARLIFTFFKEQIVLFDTFMAGLALRLGGYETAGFANVIGTSDTHKVMIVGACSAFENMSLVILACIAAITLVRTHLVRGDMWLLLGAAGVILLFNTLRLAAFASSYDAYLYWHNGAGAPLIATAQTVLAVGMAVLIARRGAGAPA